jgi:hypothetical protein
VVEKSTTFFLFVLLHGYLSDEDMAEKKDTTTNLPPSYVIPSDNKELQFFSQKFKFDMMEQVVGTIAFAVEHNLSLVEVFQFKNSDFVITLSEKDYLNNLDNIYSYYIEKEAYEYCPRIVKLQKILQEKSVKNTDENQIRRTQRS